MLPATIIRMLLIVALCLLLLGVVRAQTPLACGIADIEGPSEVEAGMQILFKAKIIGMAHTTPEFKWTVSAGTITSGQGTQEIVVDSIGLGGVDVIATVELAGVPLGCKVSASKTTQVKPERFVWGLPFDEYGDISFEDEKARLDNFAIQLANEPLLRGQILMSAGQETFKNETRERLARARSYLVNVRHVDPNRLATHDCGFAKDLRIRLMLATVGVPPAICDESQVIPLSEVKFTKRRPRPSKRLH